ncbi:pyridoxamine 5'-phosphate oxidase family protein [Nocardioides sp.]|uniref:pyridoxamine 5'-phosphate oxidase family protein n=1 Tax=Nocardioides sp. TaxID=35761 RepID=UPI003527F604
MDDELRVRRLPEYQSSDRADLDAILDDALVAHLGVVRDGRPVVLPFACARDGDGLLLHGSTGAGVLRRGVDAEVCVTVTHLDGLVFARSLFESSVHYRSAVVLGVAEVLEGERKERALEVLSDHLLPGRSGELRTSTRKELAATLVLRVPLERWSVKIGRSDAHDPEDDEPRDVWAGIVPLWLAAGRPEPAPDVPDGVAVPASARRAAARGGRLAP